MTPGERKGLSGISVQNFGMRRCFFKAAVILPQFSLRKMTTSFTQKTRWISEAFKFKRLTFSWNSWRGELLDPVMAAIFFRSSFEVENFSLKTDIFLSKHGLAESLQPVQKTKLSDDFPNGCSNAIVL